MFKFSPLGEGISVVIAILVYRQPNIALCV